MNLHELSTDPKQAFAELVREGLKVGMGCPEAEARWNPTRRRIEFRLYATNKFATMDDDLAQYWSTFKAR